MCYLPALSKVFKKVLNLIYYAAFAPRSCIVIFVLWGSGITNVQGGLEETRQTIWPRVG
eukprot:SAG31_NODE_579_length_13948_cov_5.599105_6_plen_59_part_00